MLCSTSTASPTSNCHCHQCLLLLACSTLFGLHHCRLRVVDHHSSSLHPRVSFISFACMMAMASPTTTSIHPILSFIHALCSYSSSSSAMHAPLSSSLTPPSPVMVAFFVLFNTTPACHGSLLLRRCMNAPLSPSVTIASPVKASSPLSFFFTQAFSVFNISALSRFLLLLHSPHHSTIVGFILFLYLHDSFNATINLCFFISNFFSHRLHQALPQSPLLHNPTIVPLCRYHFSLLLAEHITPT